MNKLINSNQNWLRTGSIGLIVAVVTAIFMIILLKMGITPFPKAPSLAFAETLVGHQLPIIIGLLFHGMYVIFWSVIYIHYFSKHNLKMALLLAFVLWFIVLAVFFPFVGWGFAGLNISPKMIPASLIPHLLFGLLLWSLEKYIPKKG